VLDAYVDRLVEDFSGKGLSHRLGRRERRCRPAVEKLVERLPGEHFTIHTTIDGSFPNHHPDPTVEANLRPQALVARTASTWASPSTATATGSARSTARAG
jgi:phosphomannomutase